MERFVLRGIDMGVIETDRCGGLGINGTPMSAQT